MVTLSFETRSSTRGTSIHPKSLIFLSLRGDYGVMVCLYLWACVAALSPVIVLFRSHMAASQHPTQSFISLRVLLCNCCGSVTQCPAVERSSMVGDICSPPPAKSPHHMVLFMRSPSHIPAMWGEKRPETHKLCPNDNRGNTITGNTFTTNPALSPQRLVLHAMNGRMSLLYALSY